MQIKLAKKIVCEAERYPMQAPFVLVDKSQKQKEQYRSYVTQKLDETWIEQADEDGNIFFDKFLHPQCEYIKNIKKDGITPN
jgi:hypothetical protein